MQKLLHKCSLTLCPCKLERTASIGYNNNLTIKLSYNIVRKALLSWPSHPLESHGAHLRPLNSAKHDGRIRLDMIQVSEDLVRITCTSVCVLLTKFPHTELFYFLQKLILCVIT